jgi:hypothetical protein
MGMRAIYYKYIEGGAEVAMGKQVWGFLLKFA